MIWLVGCVWRRSLLDCRFLRRGLRFPRRRRRRRYRCRSTAGKNIDALTYDYMFNQESFQDGICGLSRQMFDKRNQAEAI